MYAVIVISSPAWRGQLKAAYGLLPQKQHTGWQTGAGAGQRQAGPCQSRLTTQQADDAWVTLCWVHQHHLAAQKTRGNRHTAAVEPWRRAAASQLSMRLLLLLTLA